MSTPGDSRISESDNPSARRASAGIDAWVIRAGWQISDLTPPRLSPSVKNRRDDTNAITSSTVAIQLERHHAAEAGHLPLRDRVAGMIGQAREVDAPRRADAPASASAIASAFSAWRSTRSSSVFSPRSVSQQSNGDGHRAGRVLQELDRLEDGRVARQHRALDQIGMPGQILRDAVDDEVGAELERLLEEGRRERVVDDDQGAVRVGEPRQIAAMSDTSSRGLVGDSIHTSRVRASTPPRRPVIGDIDLPHDDIRPADAPC